MVALTFDDGPTPATTPGLLDVLAEAGAKATFFFSGPRAAAFPELVAAAVAGGHGVYGHGWDHINLEDDPDRAVDDMIRVEAELARHRPTPDIYLLRLPYNAGSARASMHRRMARFHPRIQFAAWSHDTKDWSILQRSQTRDAFLRDCRAVATRLLQARRLDGGIVLMHEQPFDIPSPFAAELTGMLAPLVLRVLAERRLKAGAMTPFDIETTWRLWLHVPIRKALIHSLRRALTGKA
ncbi:MAG TPA: polysaccharide deacetylase family protein [Patescibacteria group bacterium]|nr:polysaccharide deacetylase family protein [Patescibacteria group bacterium]